MDLGLSPFTQSRQLSTACSPNDRMTTLAVLSASSTDQLQAGLFMASRVLRPASQSGNSVVLALFGSLLSRSRTTSSQNVRFLSDLLRRETEAVPGTALDRVELIVGAHDLSVLRFLDWTSFGQLCRIPDDQEGMEEAKNS